MIISESEIRLMVNNCFRLLLEATLASDVYNKYYKDIIPENIWNTLFEGCPTMTPFHRRVADTIARELKTDRQRVENGEVEEYFYEDILRHSLIVAQLAAEIYNSGEYAKQFIINTANEDFTAYQYVSTLEDFLRKAKNSKQFSENEFINNCLYKAYEDANLLVTVTLSYSASHKYYGDSHWCTASGIGGRWNGFDMFKSYVNTGYNEENWNLLAQFVDKNDRMKSYQACINPEGRATTICNFMDRQKQWIDIEDHFGEEAANEALRVIMENYSTLIAKTAEMVKAEDTYYEFSNYQYVSHNIKKVTDKMKTKEFEQAVIDEYNEYGRWDEYDGKSPSFVYMIYDTAGPEGDYDEEHVFVPFEVRTNYDIDNDDDWGANDDEDDEDNDPNEPSIDEEAMNLSFFTSDERDVAARARRLWDDRYALCTKRVAYISLRPDDDYMLNKIYDGNIDSQSNNIVRIESKNGMSYVNMLNGEVVFTVPANSKLYELTYYFVDQDESIIRFGKASGGLNSRICYVLFEIDSHTCEVRKVNRTFLEDGRFTNEFMEISPETHNNTESNIEL